MTYTYAPDPRSSLASTCPFCAEPAPAGTGGRATCRCGRSGPVHAADVPAEPLDVLGTAALTAGQLHDFLHGPITVAGAPRRPDRPANR